MTLLRDVGRTLLADGVLRRLLGRLVRVLAACFLLGHAALALFVLLASIVLSRGNPPVTALMVYRRLTVGQKTAETRFVPLRQIPRSARDMVVRLEDFKFYQHGGIDLGAIRDAYLVNTSIGYTLYGGSTIPQQLARNLFLTPRKTYLRKYVEALIAVEMDLLLTKNRILELYLNNIEWGRGVYGIGAAALHSYGTGIGNLSLDRIRRLVTIITNPLRYNVDTFTRSRQMAARYRYLVSRFPDPIDAPRVDSPEADAPEADAPGADATVPTLPTP
ncbi:MAG: transglycosylase domain-containing protein [Spirochaetes bacterium]|nr:transglycosylase domain-containing protein [Spirochaetota bacterium]